MIGTDGSDRRVVITGAGVLCPIGSTRAAVWDALMNRRSGVGPIHALPAEGLPVGFAGEVRDFEGSIDDFGPLDGPIKKAVRKGLKVMCRETQMGVAAAFLALHDADFRPGAYAPDRIGVVYGSDYMLSVPDELAASFHRCATEERSFDFSRWGDEGMREMNPLWLLKYLPNMPACHIAIYHDLRGPSNSITQREASSNLAVAEGYSTIARGHADMVVVGATGTRVHPMKTLHTIQQEEIASNGVEPARASRPFDRDRTGMVLGEGAGAIVLEEMQSAIARGANILGEVIAGASSSVADRDHYARRDVALANAMRAAMRWAGLRPQDIGHIHAHGLASRSCDVDEARAIRDCLDEHAAEVPVTAAKSYFGNLGAGSGLVELVISLLALEHDRLPPVLNYENPDPECPVRPVTDTHTPAGDSFVNLSVTPQGQASCVIVRRVS